jgi:hypothetical protein
LVPTAAFGVGFMSRENRAVGRRAAFVAIAAALGSVAVAGLLGLSGYLMHPWFVGTLAK